MVGEIFSAVNEAFNALFFGAGSYLGILLILGMCMGLQLKWKYAGVLFIPILLFMGLEYLGESMILQAMIMWFASLFMLAYMVKTKVG